MDNVFIRALLTDKIKLKPSLVTQDYVKNVHYKLQTLYEGKCTYHGYIKPDSIEIVKVSAGLVIDVSLNGDTCFNVVYYADVCNPTVGSTVKAKVVNTNMFGILAENGMEINGTYYPILEIIVAKNSTANGGGAVDLDKIKIGGIVNIEVIGKKYELDDKKITVIGKVIENQKHKKELDSVAGGALGIGEDDADADADADAELGLDSDAESDVEQEDVEAEEGSDFAESEAAESEDEDSFGGSFDDSDGSDAGGAESDGGGDMSD